MKKRSQQKDFLPINNKWLASKLLHGTYLSVSVNNLKTGIAWRGNKQQNDEIEDTKCLANIEDNESEKGILRIE